MDDIFKKFENTCMTRYTDKTKLAIPFRKHEYGKIVCHIEEQQFGTVLKIILRKLNLSLILNIK